MRGDQWRRDGLHGHLAPWSGAETSFAQIVADGLGVPMEKIGVNHGDTLNTPGNGTMGSRGLAVGGGAVVMAMDKVRTARRRSRRTCWRRRPRISRSSRERSGCEACRTE